MDVIGDNDCDGGMDATGSCDDDGMEVIGAGDGDMDAIGGCDDDGDGDAVQ